MPEKTKSPPVDRVVAILRFLADHPDRSWTHAELNRELGITTGTLHTLLTSLAEHRLLMRTNDKRYRIGPGVFALADAVAPEPWRAWELGRESAQLLSRRLGLGIYCSTIVGDELVTIGRSLPPGYGDHIANPVAVGSSRPFAPPLGRVFVAWGDDATRRRWLSRAGAAGYDESAETTLEESLARVRRDGFDLGLEAESKAQLLTSFANLDADSRRALQPIYEMVKRLDPTTTTTAEISALPDRRHAVHNLTAPVFDQYGKVFLAVALNGFSAPLSKAEIRTYADELIALTRELSDAYSTHDGTTHDGASD
jgi:DNA-binding IclR family transcriptional regulator